MGRLASVIWRVSVVLITVNTYLSMRTNTQINGLRTALQRMASGDFADPVPLSADEPLGSVAELLERLRKQQHLQHQEIVRQIGTQSKMSGDIESVLTELRASIQGRCRRWKRPAPRCTR